MMHRHFEIPMHERIVSKIKSRPIETQKASRLCVSQGYTKMGHTMTTLNVARVYLRVSTEDQDLQRQEAIIGNARASGYYVAAVYREKASGARSDRPELLRMIEDLQPGEVVIAEKIDRISRLPLLETERLVDAIKAKGARLAVPGIVDLSE
ncbi:Stability/partitioning determinant, partial [Pseudomonas savastanoi pv. glycinea]